MTGPERLPLLQDPELCRSVRAALGLPTDSVDEQLGVRLVASRPGRSFHLFLAREGEAEVAALFAPEA